MNLNSPGQIRWLNSRSICLTPKFGVPKGTLKWLFKHDDHTPSLGYILIQFTGVYSETLCLVFYICYEAQVSHPFKQKKKSQVYEQINHILHHSCEFILLK